MKNRAWVRYENIPHNTAAIRARTGKEIIAVVKNNAYNFGLARVVDTLMASGNTHFAVTMSDEARFVKRRHPQAYVLQMNPADSAEIAAAHELGIALSLAGEGWLEEHKAELAGIELHLKVNVGMNRFGVSTPEAAVRIVQTCRSENLTLTGLFTHFPLAEEEDIAGHLDQVGRFAELYRLLSPLHDFRYIHSENSASILHGDPRLDFCNFVRPGILTYGYYLTGAPAEMLPTLYVHSTVVDIHNLPKGVHLGYGTGYTATGDERIAVLPIGYGDGLPRVRKHAPAYIGGRPYDIAGNISMSHTYLQVDDRVRVGDDAEVYGDLVRPDTLSALGCISNSEQTTMLHIGELSRPE